MQDLKHNVRKCFLLCFDANNEALFFILIWKLLLINCWFAQIQTKLLRYILHTCFDKFSLFIIYFYFNYLKNLEFNFEWISTEYHSQKIYMRVRWKNIYKTGVYFQSVKFLPDTSLFSCFYTNETFSL